LWRVRPAWNLKFQGFEGDVLRGDEEFACERDFAGTAEKGFFGG